MCYGNDRLYKKSNTMPSIDSYRAQYEKELYGKQFLELCKEGDEKACLDSLKTLNKSYLSYTYNNETPLTNALNNKMEALCLKILSYPNNNVLNYVDIHGNTILMLACKSKLESVCLKILNRLYNLPPYDHINHICNKNYYGTTALMLACFYGLENVCAEILSDPKHCALEAFDRDGYTALMISCESNLDSVSIEILRYPKSCGLDRVNNKGLNALAFAKFHRMDIVCHKISSQSVLRNMYC